MSGTQNGADRHIYTIPSEYSFADALVHGIFETYGTQAETLSTIRLFLPSRRACKTVQDTFLRANNGVPLLLPQLQPLGDMDADEISLSSEGRFGDTGIPPSISPIERQILLGKLLEKVPGISQSPAHRLRLAQALAQLMDRVHTQNLDLKDLPQLVDQDKFAQHWQITIDFLSVLSEAWPKILKERGVIDPADRRNRLIKAQTDLWRKTQPDTPVIIAGSTGSIPAVADLINVVSTLPKGCIILPGLDQTLEGQGWDSVDPTHPQYTMKVLLDSLKQDRQHIALWPACISEKTAPRTALDTELMRPADTAQHWASFAHTPDIKADLCKTLDRISLYECRTSYEEALTIAVALRETLETPEQTACLITPDRSLAAKVSAICKRWNIQIDDSGGHTLNQTHTGRFILQTAKAITSNLKPVALLSALKHTYCLPAGYVQIEDWRTDIHHADLRLRGPYFQCGLEALKTKLLDQTASQTAPPPSDLFVQTIETIFKPALDLIQTSNGKTSFPDLLTAHLKICDLLCTSQHLWVHEDGEAAAALYRDLHTYGDQIGTINPADYVPVLSDFMKNIAVRPRYGTHPRLSILGQIEARMIQSDRVILSGLNEGTWPGHPAADPWMSAPMRVDFGLPPVESSIGLSAHDFAQGLSGKNVILTRAIRTASGITVPSRWLQRLDAVLEAADLSPALIRPDHNEKTVSHLKWAQQMNKTANVRPITRPAPCPPLDARPKSLSVTRIETWLKDPYAIYAQKILKLHPVDPLDQTVTAALKGTALHAILERTFQAAPHTNEIAPQFLKTARDYLQNTLSDTTLFSLWSPRLKAMAAWIAEHEQNWQVNWTPTVFEKKGTWKISAPNIPVSFELTARVDRIDLNVMDHSAAIIDYKSAGTFSKKAIVNGHTPQLALEGLILTNGGFEDIQTSEVSALSYLVLTGGRTAGKSLQIEGDLLKAAFDNAQAGLETLLECFYGDAPAPYMAVPDLSRRPRYNDYEHLERLSEWASPDASDDTQDREAA